MTGYDHQDPGGPPAQRPYPAPPPRQAPGQQGYGRDLYGPAAEQGYGVPAQRRPERRPYDQDPQAYDQNPPGHGRDVPDPRVHAQEAQAYGQEPLAHELPDWQTRERYTYVTSAGGHDDLSLPESRAKGMIIGFSVLGVIVALMLGAIVMAVASGGSPTDPVAASAGGRTPVASADSTAGGGPGTAAAPQTTTPVVRLLKPGFGGYKFVAGTAADRLAAAVTKGFSGSGAALAHPAALKSAIYHKGASTLGLVILPAAADPLLASALRGKSSAAVVLMLSGVGVTGGKDFPAGPKGGALRCAPKGLTVVCAWADREAAVAMQADKITIGKLAALALAYRNTAEH